MHPRLKIKTKTTPQKRFGNLWKRFFPCFHRLSYINFWKTDIAVENCSVIYIYRWFLLWVCDYGFAIFPLKLVIFPQLSYVILLYWKVWYIYIYFGRFHPFSCSATVAARGFGAPHLAQRWRKVLEHWEVSFEPVQRPGMIWYNGLGWVSQPVKFSLNRANRNV